MRFVGSTDRGENISDNSGQKDICASIKMREKNQAWKAVKTFFFIGKNIL